MLRYVHLICEEGLAWDGCLVLSVAKDCKLSLTTARVRTLAGACEKVASDMGLGGGFQFLWFLPPVTYNMLVTTQLQYGRKSDENPNSKIQIHVCQVQLQKKFKVN